VALDKILIGARVRKVREEIFEETRKNFAQRCGVSDRYIAQIERGEFVPSIENLDKIATSTSIEMDYLLYGKNDKALSHVKEQLHTIIDRCDDEQAKKIFSCLSTMKNYYFKNKK
jgi:transcriptional regulator with XRE-family HTH domain